MLLHTDNGCLIKVQGDIDNRFNRGRLCVRAEKVIDAMYHPSRLKYPLIRTGERGANKWKRIGFEDAVDLIAQRFSELRDKYGAESVIFCKGTARDIGGYLPRLCYGFGSPNYFGLGPGSGNACYRPRVSVSTAILGGLPIPDLGQFEYQSGSEYQLPKCIMIWGANPVVSNPDGLHGGWITDLMKQGSELIVVDPQKTWLASQAKYWLRLKPGTDSALALGMLNVILSSNLYDEPFCREWVKGLEDIKNAAAEYVPGKAANITGIDADLIIQAARFYAKSKPANVVWGVAVDMNAGCVGTIHALISLMAVTANMENPGGMLLLNDPFGVKRRGDDVSQFPNVKTNRIGAEEYPLLEIGNPYAQPDVLLNQLETGKPYAVKGAWIQGASVIPSGFADPERALKLFRSLDFIVVVDVLINPGAAAFADVILPAAMYPEKNSIFVHFSQLGAINKAVEAPGECKSDAEIILAAGRKVAPQYFPFNEVEEWLDYRLQPSGMTFAELRELGSIVPLAEYAKHAGGKLRKDGKEGFATPSGKIELDSSILKNCGLNPLPYYRDCLGEYWNRYGREDYPFILTSGSRKAYYFGAEHRNIPALRKYQKQPQVTIHPEDADKTGIEDGEQVRIYSPFGECAMEASVKDAFPAGVVHCDYGWWFPESEGSEPHLFGVRRINVNALLPSGLQGESGYGYPFRCFICNIEKTEG